jgi:hypothetical protein
MKAAILVTCVCLLQSIHSEDSLNKLALKLGEVERHQRIENFKNELARTRSSTSATTLRQKIKMLEKMRGEYYAKIRCVDSWIGVFYHGELAVKGGPDFGSGYVTVVSVVDNGNVIVRMADDELAWLEGYPTNSLVDEKQFRPEGLFICSGTKSYKSVIGAKKTVYLLKVFHMPEEVPPTPKPMKAVAPLEKPQDEPIPPPPPDVGQ